MSSNRQRGAGTVPKVTDSGVFGGREIAQRREWGGWRGNLAVDDNYDLVRMLLHCHGDHSSTLIFDSIGTVLNSISNVTLSSTESKFGGTSLYNNGTGELSWVAGTRFDWDGDFCFEAWIKTNVYTIDGTASRTIVKTAANCQMYINTSGYFCAYYGSVLTSTTFVADNNWHHVAYCRDGTTLRLLVDGVQEASVGGIGTNFTSSGIVYTGCYDATNGRWNGYIDEVRISRHRRYTGAYTIPAAPFPDLNPSNQTTVVVSAWGAGGAGSSSSNPATGGCGGSGHASGKITLGTNWKVVVGGGGIFGASTAGGYAGGGNAGTANWNGSGGGMSGIFNTTGTVTFDSSGMANALLIAGGGGGAGRSDNGYGGNGGNIGNSGNNGTVGASGNIGYGGTTTAGGAAGSGVGSAGTAGKGGNGSGEGAGGGGGYYGGGGGLGAGAGAGYVNTSVFTIYTTLSNVGNGNGAVPGLTGFPWYANGSGNYGAVQGNAAPGRVFIVQGAHMYAYNTVGQWSHTVECFDYRPSDQYWGQVQALLHFNGGNDGTVFTDQKGHTFTGSGGIVTKTNYKVFGTASLFGTGAANYLSSTHADFAPGTGDFTYECWSMPGNATASQCLVDTRSAAGAATGFALRVISGTSVTLYTNSGTQISASMPALWSSTSRFMHFALVRSGSTWTIYINGVATGGTYSSSANLSDTTMYIGIERDLVSSPLNGWIDEFRFTKAARYTADFTPPFYPFPDF